MLRSYHDPHYVFNMEISDFVELLAEQKERELESLVWQLWLAKLPYMTQESFVSYDEMLKTAKQTETQDNVTVNGVYVDQVYF